MDDIWNEVKGVIGAVAPTVAQGLGGPFAATAVKAVTDALGLSAADAVAAVKTGDPEVLLKVKQAEQDFTLALEKIALEDDYFIQKKLYPNVDFYSGIVMRAMGIPNSMFTAIFALARTAGWVAQWQEMIGDPEHRIARPRQLYTGPARRDYVPLDRR